MEEELRADLEKLRRELHESPDLDAETRELLAGLAQEIEQAIDPEASEASETLGDRLRAATERFEESHPSLTAVVGSSPAARRTASRTAGWSLHSARTCVTLALLASRNFKRPLMSS